MTAGAVALACVDVTAAEPSDVVRVSAVVEASVQLAEWQRDGWACQDYYANTLAPFLEKCGNCRLVTIGCDHGLFYAQKPDAVADSILDFLAETTE